MAGFLAGELERRRELGYPPFRHLVRIVVAGDRARRVRCGVLAELRAGLEGAGVDLLGPAPVLRLRGRYRGQLVAKTERPRTVRAAGPARCSPQRPPRCVATGSPPSSTSTRSRCRERRQTGSTGRPVIVGSP